MRKDLKKLYDLLPERRRKQAIGVVLVMVVAAGLQAASVGALYPFLNAVTDPSSIEEGWLLSVRNFLGVEGRNEFLGILGLGVLALLVIANAALSFSQWVRLRFQWGVNHDLSVNLLESYLGRDYAYFLDHNTAEMNQNILSEATRVTNVLLGPVLQMLSNGAMALAMVALLIFVDPLATMLVIGITGAGYGVAYVLIRSRLQRIGSDYSEANRKRYQSTAEAFGGIKDVKLLGVEDRFLDFFRPASKTYTRTLSAKNVLSLLPKYVIEALAMGSLLAVLAAFLLTGQPVSLIVPVMGTFVFAGYRMMPAFRDLLNAKASFRFTEDIFASIEEALQAGYDGISARADAEPLPFGEKIELQDVTYHYPQGHEPALVDVGLAIPKNSSVAFVGKTGAGKTTIIDLLLGLLHPTEGDLRVDGQRITSENARRWRANLGYVPQEIYMADTTVRRNIAYGLPADEIDDEAVQRAAKTAHIHEFITEELPNGYETTIGEEGVRLSGGQRQRIGIARALYHDPSVIVFDEATSDIDGVTEANITRAIEDLQGTKTIITVAHRLSTIRNCDRIFVVDDGRIVASGKFEALTETSDRFNRMLGEQVVQAER